MADIPYAHAGRRRRRITEDLFRCQARNCNALVWRTVEAMRAHIGMHNELENLSDVEIDQWFRDAARIAQEGIPDNDHE